MTIHPALFGFLLGLALYGLLNVYRKAKAKILGMLP